MTTMKAVKQLRCDIGKLAICTLLVFIVGGCFPQSNGPIPEPDAESVFEQTARESYLSQSVAYSEACKSISVDIQDGEIKTETELIKAMQKRMKQARRDSVYPIDKAVMDELGGDGWSTSKASRVMDGLSDGFQSFSKRHK